MPSLIFPALLDHWRFGTSTNAHRRLTVLLAALGADATVLANDTLGDRHRRLIALQEGWANGDIRVPVVCESCKTADSFNVPHAALHALSPPPPDAVASVTLAGRNLTYRLPTMADIDAVKVIDDVYAMRAAIIDRCALDSDGLLAPRLDNAAIDAIEAMFDALDPLAAFSIKGTCSQCGATMTVRIDFAAVVAADIDRMQAELLRDIDVIASEYGWEETTISALPAERRARYIEMITIRRSGPM